MVEPSAPTVEMLWEAEDPHGVFEARFPFEDAGSAGRWVTAVVDEHWGVRVNSCDRIVMSDHNALAWVTTPSGGMLAKWSVSPERFSRLAQVARLTQWLGAQGLPVSIPVPSLDGAPQVAVDEVYIGLQRVIRGDLLDVGDADQVRAAGATPAHLHRALAAYPDADQVVTPADAPVPLSWRVGDWLDAAGDHVPVAARDTLRRLLAEAATDQPPTQLVHGDFRSANVLCAGFTVAAVIDFEEARLDHGVVEVARSAVMLETRFRDWGPVSAEVRATFLSGYESVRSLTPVEASWWNVLVLW